MVPPVAAIVSFRLGGLDGVAVEARKWAAALESLGYRVRTVAGEGPVDRLIPGLAIGAPSGSSRAEVEAALEGADVVVVENLLSLPLNERAAADVAAVLKGRAALLHHHDLPWQRRQYHAHPAPTDDAAWVHVTVNEVSRRELAERGIRATVVRNTFDTEPPCGDRPGTRAALGIAPHERLVLQPTRAIPRKNVGGALALADALGATFWLLGPAEDGFGPELERLVAAARCRVIEGPAVDMPHGVADAYAACDLVILASTWEGFGNPAIESALYRRPLAIGRYPVASELAAFGFRWFGLDDVDEIARFLDAGDDARLDNNRLIAITHFDQRDLPRRLAAVMDEAGWSRP